ncbi:MAG TPA: bifunctional isocitrate dehydrogenase kinase/phosphatase [Polyangiaceae bacterium]
MTLDKDIAGTILEGFDKHYRLFREASARAKYRFVRGAWAGARESAKNRIEMYDRRVQEAVAILRERFRDAVGDESLWPAIKVAYIGMLHEHLQPECAETFYNSVACRLLDRRYYRNEYIFRRPAISTEHLEGEEPIYRVHYPRKVGLRAALRDVLLGFGLASPFEDLGHDVRCVLRAMREVMPAGWRTHDNLQLQVLTSLFYRNKVAYVVGRLVNGSQEYPFVAPLRRTDRGTVYVDALLLKPENIGRVFSLARSYFMVDMEVPSAYVTFLKAVLPSKPNAELYTMLGLQKQGKTLFYRDLTQHMRHSTDTFVVAPGARGMVMAVFTMPSFPYVFKVIRDWFEPPKDTSPEAVREKYLFVKYHDRAGRLSDTLEYSHVALPLDRFDPALVDELRRVARSSIEIDGDQLVLRHLYIERRMTPLDVYIRQATGAEDDVNLVEAVRDFGAAIRELASADIFPGDMLPKNFGVTRYGRVVFYDYDEIARLTDMTFRRMPKPSTAEEETAGEPWFSVGPHDVFPEELPAFLFPAGRARELLRELHPELEDPAFWIGTQERIRAGIQDDVFPYPLDARFANRFGPVAT